MGVPRVHALASVDPRSTKLNSMLEGAPTKVASTIRAELEVVDKLSEQALNIAEEGLALTDAEKAAAVVDRVNTLNKQVDIENVVGKATDNGIEISYQLRPPSLRP